MSQPYQVLARKYRPSLLRDLRGQDALVRTLSNAIASNRIAHAFLLTGIRGVGKTTTARIIARSLNCVGPDGTGGPTIEPCGVCQHCTSIREDRHPDILEMDAASRTGVGDIREIIDNVRYLPISARYKIYIIDEVHMLSTNAFNALLKTLEEPPAHVKFIFATTEIRKIPVTILSRCQRFDLRRVENNTLKSHLADIANQENVTIDDEALLLIAEVAEGSVRDSLSLLDQAIAHHSNQAEESGSISGLQVRNMLGIADRSALFDLLEAIAAGELPRALAQLRALYAAGMDSVLLLSDLLELVHFITTLKITPALAEQSIIAENERVRGQKYADQLSIPYLSRLWQMLLKGVAEARQAPNPLLATEMVIIRLAYTADLPSPATIIKSLSGQPATAPAPALPAAQQEPVLQAATVQNFKDIVDLFREKKELILHHNLCNDVRLVSFAPQALVLGATTHTPSDLKKKLEEHLMEWTGTPWSVTISDIEGEPTLTQQAEHRQEQITQEAANHPVVKTVLEHFPGASIRDVKLTEPTK